MAITEKNFGVTKDGEAITLYTITNDHGNSASFINYGAVIQSIKIRDKAGDLIDCVLGYDDLASYENGDGCIGAAVGRVAGRIKDARFTLNGSEYQLAKNSGGKHHIHGGLKGFDKCVFTTQTFEENNAVCFTRFSPDGEEGYPGNLNISIIYTFDDYDRLFINYLAQADADTPINPTNHSYFNLAGKGDIFDHELRLFSRAYLESDEDSIPTGRLTPVDGTPMDFRQSKKIGQDFNADYAPLRATGGYDQVFCIDKTIEESEARNCAVLYCPETEITMYVTSNTPCLVVYTANFLNDTIGKNGVPFTKQGAVCLEAQFHPNAVNEPSFPSIILKAGNMLNTTTSYEFETGTEELAWDADDLV